MLPSETVDATDILPPRKITCNFIYPATTWVCPSSFHPWVKGYRASLDSSSTPTVPLPGSDLLYGGGNGSSSAGGGEAGGGAGGRPSGGQGGEEGEWDHRGTPHHGDKPRLRELDLHGNKGPPSRNNANSSNNRKVPNFDKVPFDREREELRPLGSSLGPAKQSPLRANGIKNNLLRADQYLSSQRTNGRDDDLVAMGTIWNPSQLQTRGSSTGTTSSGKSTSAPTASNGGGGTLPGRRPVSLSTSTSTRQLLHHQSGGGGFGNAGGFGSSVRVVKEVEPKYSDPLTGASPTFQQRLMELAALESETVRWERTKKIKKKPKADRDS
ncbi:hypothetical protein ACOMHN_043983 [Nucella lapillus]